MAVIGAWYERPLRGDASLCPQCQRETLHQRHFRYYTPVALVWPLCAIARGTRFQCATCGVSTWRLGTPPDAPPIPVIHRQGAFILALVALVAFGGWKVREAWQHSKHRDEVTSIRAELAPRVRDVLAEGRFVPLGTRERTAPEAVIERSASGIGLVAFQAAGDLRDDQLSVLGVSLIHAGGERTRRVEAWRFEQPIVVLRVAPDAVTDGLATRLAEAITRTIKSGGSQIIAISTNWPALDQVLVRESAEAIGWRVVPFRTLDELATYSVDLFTRRIDEKGAWWELTPR